jgi:hypothetical protein
MIQARIAGIYRISVGDYFYLGKSINIFSRWHSHTTSLIMNKHHSPEMQQRYNTEGLTSFRFEILETVSLSLYRKETLLKGKELEKAFNRLLLDKEKDWMNRHSINFCLNKDKKHFNI